MLMKKVLSLFALALPFVAVMPAAAQDLGDLAITDTTRVSQFLSSPITNASDALLVSSLSFSPDLAFVTATFVPGATTDLDTLSVTIVNDGYLDAPASMLGARFSGVADVQLWYVPSIPAGSSTTVVLSGWLGGHVGGGELWLDYLGEIAENVETMNYGTFLIYDGGFTFAIHNTDSGAFGG